MFRPLATLSTASLTKAVYGAGHSLIILSKGIILYYGKAIVHTSKEGSHVV